MECCRYGVHGQAVKGIHGTKESGAYSIVLSGKYEDDIDEGTTFTYTGTGGRVRSSKRGKLSEKLPQKFDQSLEHPDNEALLQSAITRNPVRVVRSDGGRSLYAPEVGVRYDGLYIAESAEIVTGKAGHQVCVAKFRRMEGQGPLPKRY